MNESRAAERGFMMNGFIFQLGDWTLEFPRKYRIVCDGTTAVVIDGDRTALVLLSLTENGRVRIERTYYAMTCEIDSRERKVIFQITDEVS